MEKIKVTQVADRNPAGELTGAWVREAVIPVHRMGRTDPVGHVTVMIDTSDAALDDKALGQMSQVAGLFSLQQVPSLSKEAPKVRVSFAGHALEAGHFVQDGDDGRDRNEATKRAARFIAVETRDFKHL